LLIVASSKEYITNEDYTCVLDAIQVLKNLLVVIYGDGCCYEITHIMICHLFQRDILSKFGVPKGFSTARYESGLSRLKRCYSRSSNHHAQWRSTFLLRYTSGMILAQNLNNESLLDPTMIPEYQLVVHLLRPKHGKFLKCSLNYCDRCRGNLMFENNMVRIQSASLKRVESRNCVIAFNEGIGIVTAIEALLNGNLIQNSGYFIGNTTGFFCTIEVEILEVAKDKQKNAPHPKLWQLMKQTGRKRKVIIQDVIGTCYSWEKQKSFLDWLCGVIAFISSKWQEFSRCSRYTLFDFRASLLT
jgi:hypothetical protein